LHFPVGFDLIVIKASGKTFGQGNPVSSLVLLILVSKYYLSNLFRSLNMIKTIVVPLGLKMSFNLLISKVSSCTAEEL
jgi:hypothetical protein